MSAETPAKSPELRVPKHGRGKLRRGGPNGGAGGRPPDEFKKFMREMAAKGENGLAQIMEAGAEHPLFLGALKYATEYAYGKPQQTTEHTGKDGGPVQVNVTHRVIRASGNTT